MTEWPLIVFTLALQLSCGICLAATLGDGMLGSGAPGLRLLGVSVLPIAAAGLIASLFHLGRPASALKSLANLGTSRLSLEILLTGTFAVAALAYSFLWWKNAEQGRMATGIFAGLTGIAAVISSSTLYLLPARPEWNSGWLPLSFIATVLIFAGVSSCAFDQPDTRLLRILLGLGTAGGLTLFASALWLIANLARRPPDLYSVTRLSFGMQAVASEHVVWFAVFLCLAVLVPITFSVRFWPGDAPAVFVPPTLRYGVFIATVSGTFIGRALMYALAGAKW